MEMGPWASTLKGEEMDTPGLGLQLHWRDDSVIQALKELGTE